MILLLAMAMLGTVPVSTNDTVWLRAAEYPRDGLGRLDTPGVRIEITVDKLGMPVACRVVNSSGSARSDALFCTIPMQRAHFKPARDENGEPIFGVVSRNFRDRFTQGAGPTWTDLTLTPDTQISKVEAKATLRVVANADGHVESCVVTASSKSSTLDHAACNYMLKSVVLAPPRDRDNAPVRSLRLVIVDFNNRAEP